MDTRQCGNEAEAKVLAALLAHGFEVLLPFGDGQPFDLCIHLGRQRFLRVQCKAARPDRSCLVFNSRTTDHGRGRRSYRGLADLFGVYFKPDDAVFLIPVIELPGFNGRLRLTPALNHQAKGVRMAADYAIGTWTPPRLALVTDGTPGCEPAVP